MRRISEGTSAVLDRFVSGSVAGPVIAAFMLSCGFLFVAKLIGIDIFYFSANLETASGSLDVEREGGFYLALNWSVYMIVVLPAYVFLLHSVMMECYGLIGRMRIRRMLVYIDGDGNRYDRDPGQLWDVIKKEAAIPITLIWVLGMIMGILQWYLYQGQWAIEPDFELQDFLRASTGADWHIAWALDVVNGSPAGLNKIAITVFGLLCYLYYTIGWSLMFSFYVFLFIFTMRLNDVAQGVGGERFGVLVEDRSDSLYGGLGALARLQRWHSWFCGFSIIGLFLMALRNQYLVHECAVSRSASGSGAIDHCTSILGLILYAVDNGKNFIGSLVGLSWSLFAYFMPSINAGTVQEAIELVVIETGTMFSLHTMYTNAFILGPAFHIAVIGGFFLFITARMENIASACLSGKRSGDGVVRDVDPEAKMPDSLERVLVRNRNRTLLVIVLGMIGCISPNMGCLMVGTMVLSGFIYFLQKHLPRVAWRS